MPQKRSKKNTSQANKNLAKRSHNGKSNASTNPDRKLPGDVKKGTFSNFRSKSKINLLNLYREKPNLEKMREIKTDPARIEPDRKWFGNIRTVDQKDLDKYRAELALRESNPYGFLLKDKRVDLQIFANSATYKKNKLTDVETFQDTFGPRMKRHKPKMFANSIEELAQRTQSNLEKYDKQKDSNLFQKKLELSQVRKQNKDKRLTAGQSKRIWEELYKVIDASDVLCLVLDARDPQGTLCTHVEAHLKKSRKFKHIVYILNKTDLVPTSVTARWVKYLSQSNPTIAFRAGVDKNFGRDGLLKLLRQFDNFHKDKKTISVGFIGYPNVGKSSVINSLKKKKVCKSAPIPGETKVWQYINLTNRIYLIDCPGVVYQNDNDSDSDIVMKGVIRAEKLKEPDMFIDDILKVADHQKLLQVYGITEFKGTYDFLKKVAMKFGRLLKQSEPDIKSVSVMIINDWQRGNIPHFKIPPIDKQEDNKQVTQEVTNEEKKDQIQKE